jgi:hypothetical protein
MIADISKGHATLADWLFLIGAVLALLAAIAYSPKVITPKLSTWAGSLVALALCSVAVGFLVL